MALRPMLRGAACASRITCWWVFVGLVWICGLAVRGFCVTAYLVNQRNKRNISVKAHG